VSAVKQITQVNSSELKAN